MYSVVSTTINEICKKYPEKTAVIFKNDKLTYKNLFKSACSIANYLIEQYNIKKGDKVALLMPNNLEFIPTYLGIIFSGGIVVPINTRYKYDEIKYIVENSDSKVLFTIEKFLNIDFSRYAKDLAKDLGISSIVNPQITYNSNFPKINIIESDVALILYTSGTTGKPKGAMLTHKNVLTSGIVTSQEMKIVSMDKLLIPLPLFHSFGLVLGTLGPLCLGATIVLMDKFVAEDALQIIEKEKCTLVYGVPTMFILMLEVLKHKSYDLTSLRSGMVGGALCPPEIMKNIGEKMCKVCNAYGITETSPLITLVRVNDNNIHARNNTVGKPLPGIDVKIVNDDRIEVPSNTIGELACRGNVMLGYYKMPEKTNEVIIDDWYYSGDLAIKDENGYIKIIGRKKDMIIVGGFNVYPKEIEDVIVVHPKVRDVAVVGVSDEKYGEVVCAAVCLTDSEKCDFDFNVLEQELRDYCKLKLADFKVPKYIWFVDELPMTSSGKVKKYLLKEMMEKEII